MPTGYKITNQGNKYFLTFTVVDWVDVFTRKIYRDIIIDSLDYCRKNKGLQVWAYVIMSNHFHSIFSAKQNNLSDIIRDFKSHTASTILKEIQNKHESRRDWMMKRFEFAARRHVRSSPHQFWIHHNHAEELRTLRFTAQKLNYIHMNPVKAGLVDNSWDWVYSSSRNYRYEPAVMEVDILDINF